MTGKNFKMLKDALDEANRWIREILEDLGETGRHRGYSALRATLHAIRDYLTFVDAMEFAKHLPPVVRGFYLDGWRHAEGPSKEPEPEDFLARIAERMVEVQGLDPRRAARSVLNLLARRIQEGKLPDVRMTWRSPLRDFWPEKQAGAPPQGPLSEQDRRAEVERTKEKIRGSIEGARREGIPEDELLAIGPERSQIHRVRRVPPARDPLTTTGLDVFDKSVQKLNGWLKELMNSLAWDDREQAFRALVAVLQAVRDRIAGDEAFQLGAQLPMILRGFYFEDWDADQPPSRDRMREEFLDRVAELLPEKTAPAAPDIARAVFGILSHRITLGEILDVRDRLPESIRSLWPDRVRTLPGRPAERAKRSSTGGEPGLRSRGRKARKEIRGIISRARARGVDDRDLPVLVSRKKARKASRGKR